MFCFTICLTTGAGGQPIDLTHLENLDFNDFHDRIWNSEINLGNRKSKLQYGWVHMERLLHNMQTQRFKESLYIVSQGNVDKA